MVAEQRKRRKKLTPFWRAILEIGFIIFLFYSNLLMGEYEHSGLGQKRGIQWAIYDIFTMGNLTIAIIFSLIGYLIVEFFRRRL
jgi:uncharacterized protein with PQ loop repeat